MTEWRDSGMAEWQNGGMVFYYIPNLSCYIMVHNDNTDNKDADDNADSAANTNGF
jgi:hypothetical protein